MARLSNSTLVVIGTGLIGSSLAKAARLGNVFQSVHAINRSSETCAEVLALEVADQATTYAELDSVIGSLKAGDLVVIAVPVRAYREIFERLKPLLPDGVVLTDVGSSKCSVIKSAEQVWGRVPAFFVPGHPIAGSEKTGVNAVNPALFDGRRCILTPEQETDSDALSPVISLWESVGSEVDTMDAQDHDLVLAATSHLPHALAFATVDALLTLEQKNEVFRYAAGGFRDFTRIAASDPVMWRDIFLSNRDALLAQLENFEAHLAELKLAISSSDPERTSAILERSQAARRHYAENNGKS